MASLLAGAPPMAILSLNLQSHISFSQSLCLRISFTSPSLSVSTPTIVSPSSLPSVYCGRGDRKTAKGKRFSHSFGNARPRNKKKGRGPPRVPVPPLTDKKDPFDDYQVVKLEIADE